MRCSTAANRCPGPCLSLRCMLSASVSASVSICTHHAAPVNRSDFRIWHRSIVIVIAIVTVTVTVVILCLLYMT